MSSLQVQAITLIDLISTVIVMGVVQSKKEKLKKRNLLVKSHNNLKSQKFYLLLTLEFNRSSKNWRQLNHTITSVL